MNDETTVSGRETLLTGLALAIGAATTLPVAAQPSATPRAPENEQRWAHMGVSLTGKTALVTGSTDGLGKEVARQLGALGAFVIVHGRTEQCGDARQAPFAAGQCARINFRRQPGAGNLHVIPTTPANAVKFATRD